LHRSEAGEDVQPEVAGVAVQGRRPDRRLDGGEPVGGELREALLARLDVDAGMQRGDDLAECPLGVPLGPVAAVPFCRRFPVVGSRSSSTTTE
jgi:hypothetical protein